MVYNSLVIFLSIFGDVYIQDGLLLFFAFLLLLLLCCGISCG